VGDGSIAIRSIDVRREISRFNEMIGSSTRSGIEINKGGYDRGIRKGTRTSGIRCNRGTNEIREARDEVRRRSSDHDDREDKDDDEDLDSR
jgi:hypothetical protein